MTAGAAAALSPAALRADFRAWLEARAVELERFRTPPRSLEDQFTVLRQLQRLLYQAGWLRWGWPAHLDGLGGSPVLRGVICEELASAGYPPPFSFGVIEILGPPVVAHAPAELVATVFPRLLRGDETWCQGFSEPDAGSDLASLRLRATERDGSWRVTGQKVWTSWAQFADRCVLLARTGSVEEAHRGITALFVDMASPGITVRPLRAMTGEDEFAELFFDDVVVPRDRVIGHVGGGWAVAMQVLACERGAVAWQRQAWMHRRLEQLLQVIELRDRAAASVGEVYEWLYALRLRSRLTLRRLAEGDVVGPDASVDKILMSTTEQALFDAVRDLCPELVLTGDSDEAEGWRTDYLYSRAASIYGGTAEIQRNIIAERSLGLPREM